MPQEPVRASNAYDFRIQTQGFGPNSNQPSSASIRQSSNHDLNSQAYRRLSINTKPNQVIPLRKETGIQSYDHGPYPGSYSSSQHSIPDYFAEHPRYGDFGERLRIPSRMHSAATSVDWEPFQDQESYHGRSSRQSSLSDMNWGPDVTGKLPNSPNSQRFTGFHRDRLSGDHSARRAGHNRSLSHSSLNSLNNDFQRMEAVEPGGRNYSGHALGGGNAEASSLNHHSARNHSLQYGYSGDVPNYAGRSFSGHLPHNINDVSANQSNSARNASARNYISNPDLCGNNDGSNRLVQNVYSGTDQFGQPTDIPGSYQQFPSVMASSPSRNTFPISPRSSQSNLFQAGQGSLKYPHNRISSMQSVKGFEGMGIDNEQASSFQRRSSGNNFLPTTTQQSLSQSQPNHPSHGPLRMGSYGPSRNNQYDSNSQIAPTLQDSNSNPIQSSIFQQTQKQNSDINTKKNYVFHEEDPSKT